MNRWLIVLVVLILTGCGADTTTNTQGESPRIKQWAAHMEAKDFVSAKAMMVPPAPEWEESAKRSLSLGPWKSRRPVDLPPDEKPYAPPGTVRLQWDLDVPATSIYKLVCSDVVDDGGKIQAVSGTLPCTRNGVYASGLEPLLYEEGDIPGAVFNIFGDLQPEKLIERGMPRAGVYVSVNARLSAADPAPGYFVNLYLSEPTNVAATLKWWEDTAPKPLTAISGVGERAFGIETQEQDGTHRSILFSRCNVAIQVEVLTPSGGAPLDFDVIKRAAEKIDQRIQADRSVCIKR